MWNFGVEIRHVALSYVLGRCYVILNLRAVACWKIGGSFYKGLWSLLAVNIDPAVWIGTLFWILRSNGWCGGTVTVTLPVTFIISRRCGWKERVNANGCQAYVRGASERQSVRTFCVQELTLKDFVEKKRNFLRRRNDSNPVEETKILTQSQAILYSITKWEFLEIPLEVLEALCPLYGM